MGGSKSTAPSSGLPSGPYHIYTRSASARLPESPVLPAPDCRNTTLAGHVGGSVVRVVSAPRWPRRERLEQAPMAVAHSQADQRKTA